MTTTPARTERIYFAILALCVVRLWVCPISSSFWLDECGTVWMAQGDLRDTLARAIDWPGQSVLYALFFSVAKSLVGHSEILLRLPSLVAMIGALVVLHKLATRLLDRESAWIAAVAFAANQNVIFAAPDARAEAFATLAVLAAMWFLVRWLDSGRLRDGILYALFASLTFYLHYLFAAMFLVHAVYAVYRMRQGGKVRWAGMAIVACCAAVFLLPGLPLIWNLFQHRGTIAHLQTPTFHELFETFTPPVYAASLLGGFLGALWFCRRSDDSGVALSIRPIARPYLAALLASWLLIPHLVLFGFSVVSSSKVYLGKYLLPAVPALALWIAWLVRVIQPASARLIVVTAMACGALLGFGAPLKLLPSHASEEWRGASAIVRRITAAGPAEVFARGMFTEAATPQWFADPRRAGLMIAPLYVYQAAPHITVLPYWLNEEAIAYTWNIIGPLASQGRRIVFVNFGGIPYEAWMLGRLGPSGYAIQESHDLGDIHVTLFARSPR